MPRWVPILTLVPPHMTLEKFVPLWASVSPPVKRALEPQGEAMPDLGADGRSAVQCPQHPGCPVFTLFWPQFPCVCGIRNA